MGDNFQSYTNLVNRISSVAPFRNKLSHQFSEISAYDKWDNNQNTKLEAKMHDFISQYDSIKKDVENIINDSLKILHKFEERYEGQGIKFNYYGSKNTYKSLNGQIRNKNN
ncbi:MAG: hypothetical protein MJ217_02725 [Bacilli bacterium]|nr:hypothetical protein [Bacilli bacterium]